MPEIVPHIRWMIRRDLKEVLYIERNSFDFFWTEQDFLVALRQRNCIGMVAEWQSRILGYMVYELHKQQLTVLNFAVDPDFRRNGIGTTLVKRLIDKLNQQRRREIEVLVRETNLDTHLFLKAMGFRAESVLHNYYLSCEEDAYVFRYRLDQQSAGQYQPKNRISKYIQGKEVEP